MVGQVGRAFGLAAAQPTVLLTCSHLEDALG